MSKYIPIKKLKKISCIEAYPGNANSPTYITTYECLCGKGKIVEDNTVGFNDHFVTFECRNCEKKYHSFIDIIGYDFVFYEINE